MTIDTLTPIPANSNPFQHDAYHMGQRLGINCTIMYANFKDKECKYFIVINNETGERIKVTL